MKTSLPRESPWTVGSPSLLPSTCSYTPAANPASPTSVADRIPFAAPPPLSNQSKVFKYSNISDEEATLLEPASCAIHGLDKLKPKVGAEVLLLGAGPTGLCMAQLLKLNGAAKVVIAANDGMKMDIAEKLNCGDEYVRLKRGGGEDTEAQWKKIKEDYPRECPLLLSSTRSSCTPRLIPHDDTSYRRL